MKLTVYWIIHTVLLLTLAGFALYSASPTWTKTKPKAHMMPTVIMAADLEEREYVSNEFSSSRLLIESSFPEAFSELALAFNKFGDTIADTIALA